MDLIHIISIASLATGVLSALIIAIDIISGKQQRMMVMNFVYPVTGLYAGPLALLFYFKIGRKSVKNKGNEMKMKGNDQNMKKDKKPFWQSVAIGALHCGSGCTLGDILAEVFLVFVPVFVFGSKLIGKWTVDYGFAFFIGIIFQYYSIKPMKNLSPGKAVKAALKADTLSLTSWQLGMYGWMAISIFFIFHQDLEATDTLFWFMMQIAMLLGFATAFPTNWWLIKSGIKEEM
ncbi:MAG: DUF4396 domain-containing protein [Bacteroidota bacterium]|nr:DUF4396 domain-containing protein [Bacteroidota bacterium]